MKSIITLVLVSMTYLLFSQNFEMPIYFEDANQNRDTIYLGIDDMATDGIDAEFNEVNIINIPSNDTFEVRITDEYCNSIVGLETTYQTKRQILSPDYRNKLLNITIHSLHHPITISWDSLHLISNVENGAVLTDTHPGGWFDVGGHSDLGWVFMSKRSEAIINPEEQFINLWFLFGIDSIVNTEELDDIDKNVAVFPNPASGILYTNVEYSTLKIYNEFGQLNKTYLENEVIDISQFKNGIYYVTVNTKENKTITKKIVILE